MTPQTPKIDSRTFAQIVYETARLAEESTPIEVDPADPEQLSGHIVYQDVVDSDLVVARRNSVIGRVMADCLSKLGNLGSVQVKRWHGPDSMEVPPKPEVLTGQVLLEELRDPGNHQLLARKGTKVDQALAGLISETLGLGQSVSVRGSPLAKPVAVALAPAALIGKFLAEDLRDPEAEDLRDPEEDNLIASKISTVDEGVAKAIFDAKTVSEIRIVGVDGRERIVIGRNPTDIEGKLLAQDVRYPYPEELAYPYYRDLIAPRGREVDFELAQRIQAAELQEIWIYDQPGADPVEVSLTQEALVGQVLAEDLHEPRTGELIAQANTRVDASLWQKLSEILARISVYGPGSSPVAVEPLVEALIGQVLAEDVKAPQLSLKESQFETPASWAKEVEALPEIVLFRRGTKLDPEKAKIIADMRRKQYGVRLADQAEPVEPRWENLARQILDQYITDPDTGEVVADQGKELDEMSASRIACLRLMLGHVKVDCPDAGGALIRIFARMAEQVIERLNQLPEKNFLAFLDLIGARLEAPQPARVPLTFELAAGSPAGALVSARTRVAATPAEGEEEPVVFETERDLVLTRTRLVACYSRDHQDRYRDNTAVAIGHEEGNFAAFWDSSDSDAKPIPHRLYLGHRLFGVRGDEDAPRPITLHFALNTDLLLDQLELEWSWWDGAEWQILKPTFDGDPIQVSFEEDVPPVPARTVAEKHSSWLRVELNWPIPQELPSIDTLQARVAVKRSGLLPDLAFANWLQVDPTKDFLPFGERPKIGDTFYLAAEETFSQKKAKVTLAVALSYTLQGTTAPSTDLELIWEFWNEDQGRWEWLGSSSPMGSSSAKVEYAFQDPTHAFTTACDPVSDPVSFRCPEALGQVAVNGEMKLWLRVRNAAGNYGEDASYDSSSGVYVPASFHPPSIQSLTVGYEFTETDLHDLENDLHDLDYVLSENELDIADHSEAARTSGKVFHPYLPSCDDRPGLYLGFERPDSDVGFTNQPNTLYFTADEELPVQDSAEVVWQYWNGEQWALLRTCDETRSLRRSGQVSFIGPTDFRASKEFGRHAFWLRARWERGKYAEYPKLRRVLLNTVRATHTESIENEILGSGNGEPNQPFRAIRPPVLQGQELQVREPEIPSAEERSVLTAEEGADAVTLVRDAGGRQVEIWVRWHQVPDFYGSGPRSRHYTLDRLSGEIGFGDGNRGLVPPPGRGNVRLTRYRTGGGLAGNRPAGTLIQLKDAVPYVAGVTNLEPAAGGTAAESLTRLRARGPKTLRHRDRAVTVTDFEDLALQASAQVARAKGIFAGDDPKAGKVELILVPLIDDPTPTPSPDLLNRVREYVEARMMPTVDLDLVEPEWCVVTVEAEIEIVPERIAEATDVQNGVVDAITAFLHPLTGGPEGSGWSFGRGPHGSDFYAIIEGTPGVDWVRWLDVVENADHGEQRRERFLVCSGDHQITLSGNDEEATPA